MTAPATSPELVQRQIRLTAHPLQRVGAFALCELAGVDGPEQLTPDMFDAAVAAMTDDAVRAALVPNVQAADGFWLKASGSYFPNSKMNHQKRFGWNTEEEVRTWRRIPPAGTWPRETTCALCAQPAVGFYGKQDVALAESTLYRNTVPRGHGGIALCWPCLCCFYALPYGCALTGGPSLVLFSMDNAFLRGQVVRHVEANQRHITAGEAVVKDPLNREARQLLRLRYHEAPLPHGVGVDLLVFSNNNQDQFLRIHSLAQPIAEWLRTTMRADAGFWALVRAHRVRKMPGLAVLARNVFDSPARIVGTVSGYLSTVFDQSHTVPADVTDLGPLCRDFCRKVMRMNDEDIQQVEALATNLAAVISGQTVSGPLTGLLRVAKEPGSLQAHLQTISAKWLLSPPEGYSGPLMTTRQFRLLFDPDGQSWLYRQLLAIAVLQRLGEQGWRPGDAKSTAGELDSDLQAHADIDERVRQGWNGDQES